jgi:L-glutamine-phosphate cytidylyltransferase
MTIPTMIILAAGQGSRLMPLTADKPKCLVEIQNKSLIQWQVETARKAGIKEIVIVTGYRGDQIQIKEVKFAENKDFATTNMVETLFCAEHFFSKDIIVSYADIIYEVSVLQSILKANNPISVIVDKAWHPYWAQRIENPLDDAETLKLDAQNNMTEIGQIPKSLADIEGQYIGLMRFQGTGLQQFCQLHEQEKIAFEKGTQSVSQQRKLPDLYMTDMLQALIRQKTTLNAVFIEGKWLEIDSISDWELAKKCVIPDTNELIINRNFSIT